MLNAENRRIDLGLLLSESAESMQDSLSILYAIPLLTNKQQLQYVQHKYAETINSDEMGYNNLLNYQSLEAKRNLVASTPQFIHNIYTFCLFCLMIRKEVKSSATMHLFLFSSISFLFQIIPLLIIGKFYRKNVVIEFCDFKKYYLPEESNSLVRFFLKFADGVIVPSDRQCRILKQKKINAVSFKERIQVQNINSRVIEVVQPKILVVTNFEEVFNVNCVLKAFELVKQKYPRSELILSGNGSHKGQVEALISSYSFGGVSIDSGFEVEELYSQSEIFVHSYHIEYFAPEILYAMAHGLPVIASPIGMLDNLIQKENILIFQFNDYSKLADHLLLLIENSSFAKKLSINSAQFIKEYSNKSKFEYISQFYQNL